MLPFNLPSLLKARSATPPQAVALLGSYARGDAGPFSDVDLLFLVPSGTPKPARNSFLVDGYLVTINTVKSDEIDGWFTEPEQVVNVVAGLQDALPLQDPQGLFAAVQARAHAFVWTDEIQAKADRYASREMVGWIEEVHKGLEGLRRNDTGRLLNARFGLSWGLAGVMRVQRGVLGNSDNSFFDDVCETVGRESRWSRLLAAAFGVTTVVRTAETAPTSLHETVLAGLHLYCETAHHLADALQQEDRPMIDTTVARITQTIHDLPARPF